MSTSKKTNKAIYKDIQVYPTVEIVKVIYAEDRQEIDNYLQKKYGIENKGDYDEYDGVYTAIEHTRSKAYNHYVFLYKKSPDIVAHEITHLIHRVAERTGLEMGIDSQEWQAYLMGYLMKEMTDFKSYKKLK